MFDYHIIEQIIELWEEAGDGARRRSFEFDQIRIIMETVFLAGLKREEDRPVQVSVAPVDPKEIKAEGRQGESVILRLDNELPFTVDALVKLAPAFDTMTTTTLVSTGDGEREDLRIWGALFASSRGRNRFDPIPLNLVSPDILIITSNKAGSLSIFRGGNIIARFNAGRFTEPTPSPFTGSLLGWRLLESIRHHDEFKRQGSIYWRIYRDMIDRLLVEANKRNHGGIIVWLPESTVHDARRWIIPKHVLKESPEGVPSINELCTMLKKREENQKAIRDGDQERIADARVIEEVILEIKRRIVEHVELLAQLTRIDGALILSERLKPLSFGSVLVATPWQHTTIYGPDDDFYPSEQVELSRFGTRHNSVVNFVGKCPGAVAFALSQDGPIAGMSRKDEETVYWWPDCLSKLWAA
ncbi:MAG: hypothetical protein HQL50_03595 [Magnetococcales bacterium]|nr:hypothetical protein [Magnetococcales bacterium]